jgi:hypothetical protein
MANWSVEETNNPLLADDRNFCMVEKWSKDERKLRQATPHPPPNGLDA